MIHSDTYGNWFKVEVPGALKQSNELFLILGGDPSSYIVPFLPVDSRAVRIGGDFNPNPDTLFYKYRSQVILKHSGPIYSITSAPLKNEDMVSLASFRLTAREPCEKIVTRDHIFSICPLDR